MNEVYFCVFSSPKKGMRCEKCGYILSRNYRKTPFRLCLSLCSFLRLRKKQTIFPPPNGLGDAMADLFASVGITKERFTELSNKFRNSKEAKECGCDWRQRLANKLGGWLGLPDGQGPELQRLVQLEHLPQQPVHGCAIHGQCLTQLRLDGEAKEIVEVAGYHLCSGCGDFSAADSTGRQPPSGV